MRLLPLVLFACTPKTSPTVAADETPCVPLAARSDARQAFDFEGGTRRYLVHVPDGLECGAPVLFDLHGAYGGPRPEEAYALEASKAAADAGGYVLVRPRGGAFENNGVTWYYWNVQGEMGGHANFFEALYDHLSPDGQLGERWVMGYSSGADLTGWMLSKGRDYAGFGMVGGSLWADSNWNGFIPDGRRVYVQLGARDAFYYDDHLPFVDELLDRGVPADAVLSDPGAGGHRLDALHYATAIPWFRDGIRPQPLPDGSPEWSQQPIGDATLLSLDVDDDGVWVGDDAGGIWHDGELLLEATRTVTGFCDGWTVAGTAQHIDAPTSVSLPAEQGELAYALTVVCHEDAPYLIGDKVYTFDGQDWVGDAAGGGAWHDIAFDPNGSGEAVTVGTYGLSAHGSEDDWSVQSLSGVRDLWFNGAAWGDAAWAVGDQGTILTSTDAQTWLFDRDPSGALPLYDVDASGRCAVAVGHGGQVLWTEGTRWQSLHLPTADAAMAVHLGEDGITAIAGSSVWTHIWPGTGPC